MNPRIVQREALVSEVGWRCGLQHSEPANRRGDRNDHDEEVVIIRASLQNRSPVVTWALLVAGLCATFYAWQIRQPPTTADFTLFYRSAERPASEMYVRPPGPPRNNMNPPHFQLLLRPLTMLPLAVASGLFRALSLVAACACVWWLARESAKPWDMGDVGALLAWAPMAAVVSLNQVTWILWPLLVATYSCWRRDRWMLGAIACGVAVSFKPFLGVLILWLLASRRPRAALVAVLTAAAALGVGIVAYGVDVFRAWIASLQGVQWWWVSMNASLEGWLARLITTPGAQTVSLPPLVAPLALLGGALILAVTLIRTRTRSIDDSWTPLVASALLASPLGWMYYAWWLLPGPTPAQMLVRSPLLWIPVAYVAFPQTHRAVAASIGSAYFWGLLVVWLTGVWPAPPRDQRRRTGRLV